MPKKFPNYKNKRVLILGLGLLGRGLKDALFFAEEGAQVRVTDLKTEEELKSSLEKLTDYDIKYTLGAHKQADIKWANLIIRNAGIPLNAPILKFALKSKKKVEMDESLFAQYCPCPIIGVTGTRGKTTTTVLIGEILKNCLHKTNVYVSGNLQGEATLPLIKKITKDDLVVLELSSWQLQGFGWKKISPQIAVFTNIHEDHLNSYSSMRTYIADKKNIFKFQKKTDLCILNKEHPKVKRLAKEVPSQKLWFSKSDVPADWKIKMPGEHNLENIAAALAVGKSFGLTLEEMEKTVCEFPGVEHRLEFVAKINDITFINDTTSTTPIAGQKALETIEPPIILIAGGATKNLDLTPFAKEAVKKSKSIILLEGSATSNLEKLLKKLGGAPLICGCFNDFEAAVKKAYSLSLPGDTVLLSPGCASFGLFKNEFDRGEQFKRIVNQLS